MIKEVIILTGISCSGKTTYAKYLEKTQGYKYIDYDAFYSYSKPLPNSSYFKTIKKLAENAEKIVIDGYFINSDKYFKEFKQKVCNNVKSIILVVSMPVNMARKLTCYGEIKFKNFKSIHSVMPYLKEFCLSINYKDSQFIDTSDNGKWKEIKINSIKELEQYLLTINKNSFKNYLDTLKYDKYYGDIEIINLKGYSESAKSWENIKNIIDWKDKSVIELGCFHGYFSFKIEEQGAKVIGLDNHPQIVDTANFINWLNSHSVSFYQWEGGDDLAECDIILCMNVLHHFKNKELALSKMKCKQAIFEINKNDIEIIKKHFTIIKEIKSHRPDSISHKGNRIILLGEKNG